MKKLFKSFIPVLTLISLFFSSCDKEDAQAPAGQAASTAHFSIKYTYTTPNNGTGSGSGDITNGVVHGVYRLDPYLHGSNICQGGKWSYKVIPNPKTATFMATQDPKTGMVTFSGGTSPASYEVTITYTCPDGTSYSATVTITM